MHAETEERGDMVQVLVLTPSTGIWSTCASLAFTNHSQEGPQPNLNYSPCSPWHNTFPILIQLILLKEHNVYEKTVQESVTSLMPKI